jgi:hypothetical protein
MPQTDPTRHTTFTGPVRSLLGETDGVLWISAAHQIWTWSGGTTSNVRIAAGQYVRNIAASTTANAAIPLTDAFLLKAGTDPAIGPGPQANQPAQAPVSRPGVLDGTTGFVAGLGHDLRGLQLTALWFYYRVNSVNATTIALKYYRTVWPDADAALPAATQPITLGGSPSVTASTNIHVFAPTLSAPIVIGGNTLATQDVIEINIVTPAGGSVDVIGLAAQVNYNLL